MQPKLGWLAALTDIDFIALTLTPLSSVLAKDFSSAGTVECGRWCSIDDTVSMRTDDYVGKRQLVTIDTSWIRRRHTSVVAGTTMRS